MKMKQATAIVIAFLLLLAGGAVAQNPENIQLRALLVTGQSNHNWQVSAPALKTMLEDSGMFLVDVAQTPAPGQDMSGFMPQFAAYSVIVLNYAGDPWPESTQKAFVDYVANGGGVVVVHEANNAFPDWPEFNEITGLGGWGNRNESHGPYVYWEKGRVIYDTTPGPGGAHGRQHRFEIIHRQPEHPITKGLPDAWLHNTDELYHYLRGPARNMAVLGTAWSDPETGGTGRDELILFTIAYGEGRVFHTALGHAGPTATESPALQCAGFIVTLQRGAEWAATGTVTQPVPTDFPEKDTERIRPRFVKDSVGVLIKELAAYNYNDPMESLVLLEELTRKRRAAGDDVSDLESAYLELLQSAEATADAKKFAFKQLSLVGSQKAVPVLAAMLLNFDVAYGARYALERIPHPDAAKALREAVPLVGPEHRAGIIASLGALQDTRAVEIISAAVHDADEKVAEAAIRALAEIPDGKAADALLAAIELKNDALQRVAKASYLKCGFTLLEARHTNDAKNVFEMVQKTMQDDLNLRETALRGRIEAAFSKGADVIVETLKSNDTALHPAAAAAVRNVTRTYDLQQLASLLSGLEECPKVLLLTALAETGVANISPQLMEAAQDEREAVRIAAFKTLAVVGDKKAALFLVERAAATTGAEQDAVRFAISRLKGADKVILEAYEEGNEPLRAELLKAIAARHIKDATPLLIERIPEASPEERLGIMDVLTQIAEPEHLEMIVPLLLSASEADQGVEMAQVVATIAGRSEAGEGKVAELAKALETNADPVSRVNVYVALGKIADDSALPLLEKGMEEQDANVRLAAVEALANWPTDNVLDMLHAALERFKGTPEGATALNGYIRVAGLNTDRAPEDAVALYEALLPIAATTEGKQACIAAIGKTGADAALPVLFDALASNDVEVARDAVQALGAWPNAVPMARLEILAKDGPEALRADALRGYFRLIGINHEISEEEAVIRYRQALSLAPDDAERKRIMAGLAGAETMGAITVVLEYLDNPELKSEAEVAAVKIAAKVAGANPTAIAAALDTIAAGTENEYVRGEIEKVRQGIARFEDYITAWEVSGPYTDKRDNTKRIFETAFEPEKDGGDAAVDWRLISVGTNDSMPYLVELDKALGGDNRAAYLRTNVWSPTACEALLEIGSDDGNRVWLNGELVTEVNKVRPVSPAQDTAKINLKEGWNTLLVKVIQGGGQWCACVRIRTTDGSPLQGLRVSVRPE
jgi:uncharacterized protein